MKHLSKLVVGTLSLAVMLVGFVPSLARAQMAIAERIEVPNNCAELYGGYDAFGDGHYGPLRGEDWAARQGRRHRHRVVSRRGRLGTNIAEVILNYQWRATFEKGQGADVKGPWALQIDGKEFQDAGKTYLQIYGKTTHVKKFPNINARTTGLLTWKIDGAVNKPEWEADFNHLQGWKQIPGSEAIVVKISVSLTRNGVALGNCRSAYVPVASDPTLYLLCEEDCFLPLPVGQG